MAATNQSYLQHLMAAAVALPGISMAATPIDTDDVVVEYKHVYYSERDDLMQVNADYFAVALALNERNDLQVSVEYETMSGASPIFTSPDANGEPEVITSGASIADQRTAVAVRYRHFIESGAITFTPSWSDEDDYTSTAATLQYEWDINNKNTSFAVGAGFASDTVSTEGQVFTESKRGASAFVGVTQLLDPESLMQLNFSYATESGYLSDPYKLVLVQGSIEPEKRPDDRAQMSALARYIRHVGEAASVHLTYRLFTDDWSLQSHTFELSWYQEMGNDWTLNPNIRYYSQDQAEFYQPYFVDQRSDGNYSSDFRLASYGSVLAGLTLGKTIDSNTAFDVGFEYYQRRGDLKLTGDYSLDPEPLTSYVITLGVKHTF